MKNQPIGDFVQIERGFFMRASLVQSVAVKRLDKQDLYTVRYRLGPMEGDYYEGEAFDSREDATKEMISFLDYCQTIEGDTDGK